MHRCRRGGLRIAGCHTFESELLTKIGREITGDVPAPATLAGFGPALLGLAGLRRRA